MLKASPLHASFYALADCGRVDLSLPDRDLALAFGISRPVVRNARLKAGWPRPLWAALGPVDRERAAARRRMREVASAWRAMIAAASH